MNLNEYQSMARETAVYEGNLYYPALGLAGEICEAIEKANDKLVHYEEIQKEIGDVLWYVANVAQDAGLNLSDCAGTDSFGGLEKPQESDLDVALIKALGPVMEMVKKCFRDDGGVLNETKKEAIRSNLGELLNVLGEISIELGTTLEKIAEANYAKLKSRQERGTLQGSGDNR